MPLMVLGEDFDGKSVFEHTISRLSTAKKFEDVANQIDFYHNVLFRSDDWYSLEELEAADKSFNVALLNLFKDVKLDNGKFFIAWRSEQIKTTG